MLKKLIRCNTKVSTANMAKKTMHVGKVNNKDLHAEYYVIENVSHMIRGAVMNGLRYGDGVFDKLADELMTSNARIPAPMSHPSDENGNFVDANDPITFPSHNVGAFDTDWRVNGDKLVSNTYIPVDSIANPKAGNEWFSESVNNGSPIDRSTGLYLNIDDSITGYAIDGEPFGGDVTEIFELNHSAILNPNIEPGAKNNGEGVGMFCNAKGDKIEIEECDLSVNASTPALRLPLAPDTHVFNEAVALANIKAYTNSNDKPSTSYRKFFLSFNQEAVDSFDSYTNLFADIIDNIPHAVKSQVSNVDNDHAKAYVNRFDSIKHENNSLIETIKTVFNSLFANKQASVYNTNNKQEKRVVNMIVNGALADLLNRTLDRKAKDEDEKSTLIDSMASAAGIERDTVLQILRGDIETPPENRLQGFADVLGLSFDSLKSLVSNLNNNGDRIMRDKILAALNAAKIETNGLSDDALFTAYNEFKSKGGKDKSTVDDDDKDDKKKMDKAANDKFDALVATVNSLAATITANADKDLEKVRSSVVALNKGIDEDMAKVMTIESCNKFLASHGHVAVNAHGKQTQVNASDSCSSLKLEA